LICIFLEQAALRREEWVLSLGLLEAGVETTFENIIVYAQAQRNPSDGGTNWGITGMTAVAARLFRTNIVMRELVVEEHGGEVEQIERYPGHPEGHANQFVSHEAETDR